MGTWVVVDGDEELVVLAGVQTLPMEVVVLLEPPTGGFLEM